MPIKLMIVDDTALNIDCLKLLFGMESDFLVVGSAKNGKEALELINNGIDVDIILMDYLMPTMDGGEVSRILLEKKRLLKISFKIVILSVSNSFEAAIECINLGANGFIMRSNPFEEFKKALIKIQENPNRIYLDPGVERGITHNGLCVFSDIEKKILCGILEEESANEIAIQLGKPNTEINDRIQEMRIRTGSSNLAELVLYVLENRIIPGFMPHRPGPPQIPKIIGSSKTNIPVYIIDDEPIILEGLNMILSQAQPRFKVLGTSSNASDAIEAIGSLAREHEQLLVTIDIDMPEMNGIEATKTLVEKYKNIYVVILTIKDSIDLATKTMDLGAKAFITKNIPHEDLIAVLHAVYEGHKHVGIYNPSPLKITFGLEDQDIIRLIAKGFTDKDIAKRLLCDPEKESYVEGRRTYIRRKIGCRKSTGIVIYAWINRLLD